VARAAVDRRRLVPADGVRLKILDDEGILFDERSRKVYFLNTAATLIWCRIESEGGISPIAATGKARAAAGAPDIAARWAALGLLVAPGASPRPPVQDAVAAERQVRRRRRVRLSGSAAVRRDYRLLDTEIALAFGEAWLAALVHPTLAHLELGTPPAEPLVITIDCSGGRFRLIEGEQLLDACRSPDEVAPLVKLHVARHAVAQFPHRLAVHAGALARSAGALLLPAPAGSGKSVLTAALMTRGWDYLSDDTAMLAEADFSVTGVPYSLSIKEGGWDALESRFPALLHQPVHRRPDGQRVRYLPPLPPRMRPDPGKRTVRWIAFPQFSPSAPPAAPKRLKLAEALRRLLANCGWVRPLDWETISRTVEWLGHVESYSLDHSSLDTAIEIIEKWSAD
jgi:hypothetical protein